MSALEAGAILYGDINTDKGGANGFILAYCLKLGLVVYAVAHHEYGFRLPSPPDLSFLLNLI